MADYYRFTLLHRDTGVAAYCKPISPQHATKTPGRKYTPDRLESKTKADLWEQIKSKYGVNRRFIRRGEWVVTTVDKIESDDDKPTKKHTV
jgi:hypothetical protein